MPRLSTLDVKATGTDPFGLANYNKLKSDVDYVASAGADLAAVGGGNTLAITNEFHKVTAASGLIDSITDVAGLGSCQQIRLLFANAQTIRNNGGGAGNIRTRSGGDRSVSPNEIVTLNYEGAVWREVGGVMSYRKKTSKTVVNTVTETDLLNGEVTLAAGDLGIDRVLRLSASGDWLMNNGGNAGTPRWKLKLGATTIFDTSTFGAPNVVTSGSRLGWRVEAEITNLTSGTQWCSFKVWLGLVNSNANLIVCIPFTTGEGQQAILPNNTGTTSAVLIGEAENASAVDTTTSLALTLTVTLAVAHASVDMILKRALAVIE